jgi:N-acetylneuraminic acid mutarotase
MATARVIPTLTQLASGGLLVVGGADVTFNSIASAELYDPVSDSWSSAHSMAIARNSHTATLLSSGQVLVAGGLGSSTTFASAELYDPPSNAWISASPMQTARRLHTATPLNSGAVLVAGGYDSSNDSLASTELYSPSPSDEIFANGFDGP